MAQSTLPASRGVLFGPARRPGRTTHSCRPGCKSSRFVCKVPEAHCLQQISHPTALHHVELDRLESAVHAFPPYPIASFLLSVLIKHATDTFFYVDQAEFASEIHQFYTDPTSPLRSDSTFVCLAMAAFALASQWTTLEKPEGYHTSVGLERSDLGRVFFDHARMLIPDIIERPCLRSVQAPFVLGVYLMPASAIGSSYVYLGMALRNALALDLHQDVDDQKMNEREIEVRRRLWWSLYSLERLVPFVAAMITFHLTALQMYYSQVKPTSFYQCRCYHDAYPIITSSAGSLPEIR